MALSPRESRAVFTRRIHRLCDHSVISTIFCLNLLSTWPMIQEAVAHEFECDPDDVGCIETDDGDQITARGVPVAYIKE